MDKTEFEDNTLRLLPEIDVDTLECLHTAAELHSEICPPDVFYKVVFLSISRVLVQEGKEKALELAEMQWAGIDPAHLLDMGCMISFYEGATDMDSPSEWMYSFLWVANNRKDKADSAPNNAF